MFLLFQFVCPVPEGLSRTAMSAVGILACCIILWVSEAFPFIVTVVLIYLLLPITDVLPFATTALADGTVVQSVFNQSSLMVPIYCLFIFAVTAAVMTTPIPYRVANFVLKWSKGNSAKIVIGLMMATGIFLSLIHSSVSVFKSSGTRTCVGDSTSSMWGGKPK